MILEEFSSPADSVNAHTLPHNLDAGALYEPKETQTFPHVRRVFRITDQDMSHKAVDEDYASKPHAESETIDGTNDGSPKFTIKRDCMEHWLLSDIVTHIINAFDENYHKCADFIIVDVQHTFPSADIPRIALSVFVVTFYRVVHPFGNASGPTTPSISNRLLYDAYQRHSDNM